MSSDYVFENFSPKTLSPTLPFLSTFSAKIHNCLNFNIFFSLKKIHAIVGNTDLDQEAMGRSPL